MGKIKQFFELCNEFYEKWSDSIKKAKILPEEL